MTPVGFSSGALRRVLEQEGLQFSEALREMRLAGGTALELSMMSPLARTDAVRHEAELFDFVTLHAPIYSRQRPMRIHFTSDMEEVKKNALYYPVQYITVHPDLLCTLDSYGAYDLPFALENMDSKKDCARGPQYFQDVPFSTNVQFRYVLDLQHAYENDPTLRLACDLRETMGARLRYYHVSGQTRENRHAPLHKSDNRNDMAAAVASTSTSSQYPIILEGKVDSVEEMTAEISHIRQLVG